MRPPVFVCVTAQRARAVRAVPLSETRGRGALWDPVQYAAPVNSHCDTADVPLSWRLYEGPVRVLKVVLFCGGYGLRLRDHEPRLPKPVVALGNKPLVLHLMRYYAHFGHTEFILCLGYKGDVVRSALERAMAERPLAYPHDENQDLRRWKVHYVDTGVDATIADRLVAVRPYLGNDHVFFANYSDSLSDADLPRLTAEHMELGVVASFMCVKPHLSLHHVEVDEQTGIVSSIRSIRDALRINGGFFTFDQRIFDYIEPGDELVEEPFERLISAGLLHGHVYDGFWSTIDTFKDHMRLSSLLKLGPGPWQVWRKGEAVETEDVARSVLGD